MFKRFMTLMVISSFSVSPVQSASLTIEQQALNNVLAQLASTHEGVYIETVLHGFNTLAEGAEQLLTQPTHCSAGARRLLEGVAQLTACALQAKNGTDSVTSEQAVAQVEALVLNFKTSLTTILNTPNQSNRPVSNPAATAPAAPQPEDLLAEKPAEKDAEPDNEKLLVEGLTQIFYNVFCMLISPNDLGLYLKNVFTGLLKVLSAVLADGKVGREDLEILGAALGSIFNLRGLQKQLIQKQNLALGQRTYNSASPCVSFRNSFETQEMSLGLAKITQSFMALLANPKNALSYLQELCQGLMHLFLSIFADGKVDQHDLDNLVEVIKSNETKALVILQAQDYRCAY